MKAWVRFLLGRAFGAVFVVWAVVSAVFVMAYWLPVDPARAAVGPHADNATVERVRALMCLDKPFLGQYVCHVGRLVRLDFGTSFRAGRPVWDILAERLPSTIELAFASLGCLFVVSMLVAVWSVRSRHRVLERATMVVAWCLQGVPPFVLGPLLAIVFSHRLRLLPDSGAGAEGLDRLRHLVLPVLTIVTWGVAAYSRVLAGELRAVVDKPFVRVAIAKGSSEGRAIVRHVLPNALGPIVAMLGVDMGTMLGGAAAVEYVFGWPGLGREALLAVLDLDLPVVLGVVFVTAVAVVLSNLAADLVHVAIDPRLRPR